MPETIGVTEFGFSARFDRAGKSVRFSGPGGFFDAVLLRGALDGLAGLAFTQLGRPTGLLGKVRRSAWNVVTPRWSAYHPGVPAERDPERGFNCMGENRRILVIRGPEVLVLRFSREIPRGLTFALKTLFTGLEYPRDTPGVLPPSSKEASYGPGQESSE